MIGSRRTAPRGTVARPVRRAGALLGMTILLTTTSCAPPPSRMQPATGPGGFDIADFFDGASYSKGTVTTAFVSTQAFTAEFTGTKAGRDLALDERFAFADGTPLQRWDLTEVAPGRYAGTVSTELDDGRMAPAVPVEGVALENGLVLAYDGFAPGGGDTLLGFRHEMTRNADGTVANHVVVSKFGLPLASSDVTFAKTKQALAQH